MILHDLNIRLLVGLGFTSWIGLCCWNAFAACDHLNGLAKSADSVNGGVSDKPTTVTRASLLADELKPLNSQSFTISDWLLLAALANAGVCLAYYCMSVERFPRVSQSHVYCKISFFIVRKQRFGHIGKKLSQLSVQLDENFSSLLEQCRCNECDFRTGLTQTDNLLNTVSASQDDVRTLVQRVLDTVHATRPKARLVQPAKDSSADFTANSPNNRVLQPSPSNAVNLTAEQHANIERSLFYLEQIADYFQKRLQARNDDALNEVASGQDEKLCAVRSLAVARRSSPRSVRSDIILKRLSRELIQPIRKRYNGVYLMRAESQQQRKKDVIKGVVDTVREGHHHYTASRKTRSATNAARKKGNR